VSFELDRRDIVEGVVYGAVVEPVDVFERLPFDVLDAASGALTVDQFGLVETVETLSQRVIEIALGANRRDDLCLVEALRITKKRPGNSISPIQCRIPCA
jgi:hypothetical protein